LPQGGPRWLKRTLARLVEQVRTLLPVDAVAFLMVDGEGRAVEPRAGWFASPELRAVLESRARPSFGDAALERDRPLLLPRVEAWQASGQLLDALVESLGEERARRAWDQFAGASLIACRLRTETGRPLGVLVVASLERNHRLLATDLRSVEVIADLAAMALDRADLLEAEGVRARRELRLKRATEAISGSLELDVVYRSVAEHATSITGGSKAALTRLSSREGELRTVARVDFSEAFSRGRLSFDSGTLGIVARTRIPLLVRGDHDAWDAGLMERERIASLMHAPLELGPRLFGVLSVAHEEPDRFTEADLEVLAKFARSSAAAIANAIDFQRERRIARALTLGFVPESLPDVPGFDTGLLYAPAANEPTGGDVYGAWPLPGGEVALLIGDVAGKGVETAALSAMVRFFVEARTWDEASPAAVLSRTNAMLLTRLPSDTFVTAFLAVLSPDSLRYCNAGHQMPLLVSRTGTSPLLGHGLPLGIDPEPGYGESELLLNDGDLVFAFTDGLIEARRAGEMYGLDRLARLVDGWSRMLSPEALVRAVHEEVAGWADGLSDDAVALALRRHA
jgi:GAF domain-containing protein